MIIALNGLGRAGKDTACRMIQEILYPRPVYREGFADRLKVSAAAALGLPIDVLESLKDSGRITIHRQKNDPYEHGGDPEWEFVQSLGVRRYLERYGTEAHRNVFAQDFWVEAVMNSHWAHREENSTAVTVITDLRFPNEAEKVSFECGEVWEIVRPGHSLESDHSSNQPLPRDMVDRVIQNDSDLTGFRFNVAEAVRDTFGVAVSGPVK